MLFDSMDFRVTAPGELNMDTGLLFIHNERAGPEREDIGPYIAAGKEFINPGDGIDIRAGDSRDEIFFFYHAPQFRDFFHQSFRGLFCCGWCEAG